MCNNLFNDVTKSKLVNYINLIIISNDSGVSIARFMNIVS